MSANKLLEFRREYLAGELLEKDLLSDPYYQFMDWLEDAMRSGIDDPTAMALATSGDSGRASVRIVLLKDARPEGLVFFSNYQSRKGLELDQNPQASVMFFWPGLDRQVRVEGSIEKVSSLESDEFFRSRPLESRISSLVSPQSREIPGREELERKFEEIKLSLSDEEVIRPEFWGGYLLIPDRFEFWQGRENRLNDRILYALIEGEWKIRRLAP